MSISGTGRTPTYGHITTRIRDTMYARVNDIPGMASYGDDGVAQPENAPWPAFSAAGGFDVHIVPRTDHCLLWLVDAGDYEVLAEVQFDAGAQFGPDGPQTVATTVQRAIDGHDCNGAATVRSDITEAAWDATADLFADPFDETLRTKLERPQSRWLKTRTASVVADQDQHGRTVWTPTLTAGRAAHYEHEWAPEFATSELVAQYDNAFKRDYRRQFREKVMVMNAMWYIWFSVSHVWLSDRAIVKDYAEADLVDAAIEDYQFRQSSTGTWHLQHQDGGPHGCKDAGAVDGRARDASLDGYPVPSVLCPACSRRLKELQADRTLRAVPV